MPQLVDLTHGFIEDRRDYAAVAMSGRAGKALAEFEAAHETIALFVINKAQAHPFGIVGAASEAMVSL